MNCKRCGKNVPVHSKVCPECGLSNPYYVPRPEAPSEHFGRSGATYSDRGTTAPGSTQPTRPVQTKTAPKTNPNPNPRPTQAQQAAAAVPPQPQTPAKPASTGSDNSFVKFLLLVAVVIGIVFLLKNCDTIRLKGTWDAADGSGSITFSDKDSGYVTIGGRSQNFSYFVDGDEIEIKTVDTLYAYSNVVRFEFEIDGDTLWLTDTDSGITEGFKKR